VARRPAGGDHDPLGLAHGPPSGAWGRL
jgi:hypothetical protein